jgi:polysaccharide chain length determinant protein (PEP-CTERM system associated)
MASTGRAGLDALLASILRRRWIAAAVFIVVLSGALSFAKSLPSLYQSTATVLVERPAGRDGADDTESRLQSLRKEILSRTRLAALAARFDLYPKLRGRVSEEAIVSLIRHDVRIDASGTDAASGGGGTIAFALAYRGREPRKVAEVANALTTSYIEEDQRVRERQTSGAASVLLSQLEDVKKRLALQETRIAEFKKTHAGALPQQTEANLSILERTSAQIEKVHETRAAAMERRAALLKDGNEHESAGDATDPDRARLERFSQELVELRTRFSEKHPDVVHKRAEVASLAAVVASKPAVDRSLPQLEQANREIRALQAQEARLRGEAASYQQRVEGAPWHEQEFQGLSRDYAATRDFYESLLKRHEEAQLAETHEGRPRDQRLRLLDPAVAAWEPLAPNRFRLAVFGLIAALALSIVAVAAAEKLDTSFHSADALRRHTRVPILVRIPKSADESALNRRRRRWRAAFLSLGLVLGSALAMKVSQVMARDNEGVVALFAPRGRS